MTDTTAAQALGTSLLPTIASSIEVPQYDRSALRPSIVHIGVGGFHRAHLATYVDELCAAGNTEWAIVGAGVLPGDAVMDASLKPQDMLYTLITRGAETSVHVIGSMIDYILAAVDPQPLIDRIAHADTQIVSLTVTEGGYPIDDITGDYLADSPNAGPGTAFDIIAAGLDQRRITHGKPISIMSCDNIMSNGHVTRVATLGAAQPLGPELAKWIAESVSFPNSMVDRITPATTDADRVWLSTTHGIDDQWPVVTEPFRQWVVEDNFAGERPPLEELDVIVTADVEPYEFMKLRLLNAGHSCLAYLAALDGIETVDAAMADPAIEQYVRSFLAHESKPVLPEVAGIDIDAYNESLIERFSNPAIGDQISRLCLDGSAKFPKFLLPTVRAQLEVDGPVALAALALAGWCQYLIGTDNHGAPITLADDPNLDEAIAYAQRSVGNPAAFLSFGAVFGTDIAASDTFRSSFIEALQHLRSGEIRSALDRAIDQTENRGGTPT